MCRQCPLAFCSVRWALDELNHVEHVGALPPEVATRKLYEIVAVVAQQFRGYIFKVNEPQVCASVC